MSSSRCGARGSEQVIHPHCPVAWDAPITRACSRGAFIVGLLGGRFLKGAAPAGSQRSFGQYDSRASRGALPQYGGSSGASNERYRSQPQRTPSDSPMTRSDGGGSALRPQQGSGRVQAAREGASQPSTFTIDPKQPAGGTSSSQGVNADTAAAARETAARPPQERSIGGVGGAGSSTKGSGIS